MKCPKCDKETHITDSRKTKNNIVRRRRECICCKFRFTTYEIFIAGTELKLLKKYIR
ncbi:MAG: hypothetical protein ACOC22_01825 [bacterium]